MSLEPLDPVIHERVRLGILGLLAQAEEVSFGELKQALGVSDGNLASHLRLLEREGIVAVRKTFVGRRPRTLYRLTPQGRERFYRYLEALKTLLGSVLEEPSGTPKKEEPQ